MKQTRFFVVLASAWCLGVFLFFHTAQANEPHMVISEIGAYEPHGQEWIEVMNVGHEAIDMSGWTFWEDGTNHRISVAPMATSTIQPGGYAIIAQDAHALLEVYPHIAASFFDSSWGSLKEGGELIGLKNDAGEIIDQLTYLASPTTSLQKRVITSLDAGADNWIAHHDSNTIGGANEFAVAAPPEQEDPIMAEDDPEDEEDVVPEGALEEQVIPTKGNIVLSEIVSQSDVGEWVELWNAGTSTVDITNWSVHDGVGVIAHIEGVVTSGSYFVVDIDGAKLNNGGDTVQLYTASGTLQDTIVYGNWEGATVDAPSKETSIVRTADDVFTITTDVTRGAPNIIKEVPVAEEDREPQPVPDAVHSEPGAHISPGDVLINEFVSDPADDAEEFIELFNTTDRVISMQGWRIEEGSEARTLLSGSIAAQGYHVIEKPKGSLNNGGDSIVLYDHLEQVIDHVTYGSWDDGSPHDNAPLAKDPQSTARKGDGQDTNNDALDFSLTDTVTPGEANRISLIVETDESHGEVRTPFIDTIRITEVFPNPTGSDAEDEFIEVYNEGEHTVDMTGWKLGDASKKRYTFPATRIVSQERMVFTRSRTGIALNNSGGDEVKLYGPGGELIDHVSYGSAPEAESYAKKEDQSWVWTVQPTPAEANIILGKSAAPQIAIDVETEVVVGEVVLLDASDTTDPDGDEMHFVWSIDGGYEEVGDVVEYAFTEPGIYTVTLTVSDAQEHVVGQDIIITVHPVHAFVGGNPDDDPVASVVISEFIPNPEGSDTAEFIELYNPTTDAIDISGMKLDDEEGGSRAYTFPDGTIIEAQEYVLLGKQDTKLALNNSSDAVRMLYPDGTILHDVPYDEAVEGASYVFDEEQGMWVWTGTVTPGALNIVSERAIVEKRKKRASSKHVKPVIDTTLARIRDEDIGDLIRVSGVVSVLPGVFGSQYFYIGDAPGLQVYMYKKDFPTLQVGDVISVAGEVSQIAGEARVKLKDKKAITIEGHGAALQTTPIEIAQIGEQVEGWLASIEGEVTELKSSYMYVDDGTEEVKVYFKKGTGIEKKVFSVGDVVHVTGSQSRSGFQLLPRSQMDIQKIGTTELPTAMSLDDDTADSEVAETYLTATAGGLTSIIVGLLAKVHGSAALRFARRVGSAAIRRKIG